jgi:hypothetical protein
MVSYGAVLQAIRIDTELLLSISSQTTQRQQTQKLTAFSKPEHKEVAALDCEAFPCRQDKVVLDSQAGYTT